MIKVAIDAMGGDFGPLPIIEGTLMALQEESFHALLVGDEKQIMPHIPQAFLRQIDIVHCCDVIAMDDLATNAIRRKDSSIFVATDLVRDKRADALVSVGHSGATMSLATLRIGRVEGVSRPAICAIFPRIDGKEMLLLDAGANVDCNAEHLYAFGLMGYEYAKNVFGYLKPSIGLLSIGEEEGKGNELTKEAYKMLSQCAGFLGNIEGDNLFDGSVDVVVCDGFVGNVVLKTSEGIAEAIVHLLKEHIKESISGQLGALLMRNVFKRFKKRLDYAEYGGAPLLGINGNVIIGHGKSNPKAISSAIKQAILADKQQVHSKIAAVFKDLEK